MPSDRWQRIEEIFQGAAELQGEERAAYLQRECAGDAGLREEVESLLSHDAAGSGESIAAAVHGAVGPGTEQAPTEAGGFAGPGEMVGPYRIEREIGRGGMGAVYLAFRADDQFRKQVAIKVMRRHRGRPDLVQRFQIERQILATLEHPNIARMLDGGTTEAGEPYVVMEHVEGESLDAYCNQRRLGTRDRLKLFQSICSAVQYAHRNLVVHRDLKPGNILVTHDGETKLLDFGIAKLLNPELSEVTVAETATEQRVLTPEYASPEQLKGEAITTATDVYSLGVVLYELLTGRRPYRLKHTTTGELERAIVEQEPERPSTAISRDESGTGSRATDAETVSRERGTAPDRLRRQLSGDLDNIVLMALRKEPGRRYASAEALSEDIRRHLEGLPVSARAATLVYRARKFVRRNAAGVVTAAAVAALIAVLVAFYTVRLNTEKRRAEIEARTNARVTEFLVGLFEKADPRKARGEEVTARELLDSGVESIGGELREAPEVQARLLETMSHAYWNMAQQEKALEVADRALALQERIPGDRRAATVDLLKARSGILVSLARYDEARESLERALDLAAQVYEPGSEAFSRVRREMGLVAEKKGEFEDSEKIFREGVEDARRLSKGEETLYLAQTLLDLGRVTLQRGRHQEAIEILEECVRIQSEALPEIDAQKADGLNLLGAAYYRTGDYEKAEPLFEEALSLSQRIYGEGSLDSAFHLTTLGNLYKARGQPDKAEPLLREALEIHQRVNGDAHPNTGVALNNLANVMQDQGRYREAEPLLRRALEIHRTHDGDEHPATADILNNLGDLLRHVGEYEEAEAMFRETLAIDLKTLGESHEYVAMDYANLAALMIELESWDEVEDLVARALAIQEGNEDINPFNLSSTLLTQGEALFRQGRLDEAEPVLRRALAIREKSVEEGSALMSGALGWLGECLAAQGKLEAARPLMERNYELTRATRPPGHEGRKRAAAKLIELYESMGETALAAKVRAESPPAKAAAASGAGR